MSYTVYKHIFPNNKVYIGITSLSPKTRWGKDGSMYLKKINDKYKQPLIANAINKYGWDNIKHEILFEGLTKKEAEQKEIELIAKYQSNKKEFGYNIANGGNAHGTVSDETKKKISKTLKGREISEETRKKRSDYMSGRVGKDNPRYGKHHTEETKRMISEAQKGKNNSMYGKHLSEERRKQIGEFHKGKKLTEETKRKMSEAQSGENHWNYGGHITEEHKQKISNALKGREISEETKRKISEANKGKNNPMWGKHRSQEVNAKTSKAVRCIETNQEYYSINYASKETGISDSNISRVCRGERKTAGGFHWEYI